MLRIRNAKKSFGDHVVLDGIDLDVAAGEVVCLIGASGSGKSTLLKCINQLELLDDGDIFLGETELTDPAINLDKARARIGMVFQAYNLFPHMSVLKNLMVAQQTVHGTSRSEAKARSLAILERVDLSDKAHAFPDSLSGGQQQRVALARAVVTEPELILLDEVTSALDPLLVGEVLDFVAELKAEGRTIVMATHEMSFARSSADRIVFLADGRVVESGTPESLFHHPRHALTAEFLARYHD